MNFKGKINYFLELIINYKDWYLILFKRLFNIRIKKIYLRNGPSIIGGKRSLVLDIVKEIFIDSTYNPKYLSINKGDVVIDIGANIGVFSLYAAKKGAHKIFSIEPLLENISVIKENFRINGKKSPVIIEKAVSNKINVVKFYLGNLDSHGTLSEENHEGKFEKYIRVKTTTLGEIIKQNKIKKIDFLKIDCEGGEGVIVKSATKRDWDKIEKVAIEYHDDSSILSHTEIINRLNDLGYNTEKKITGNYFGYIYAWKN